MNIVLIGFMGSGKSHVAQSLSKLLDWLVIEMDELVCQKTNSKNMQEVFAKGGELLLRETEITITKEIASKKNLVISTGGGVVLNKIILDYFKKNEGKIIFLDTKFEKIAKRLETSATRPLLRNHDMKELYNFRLPLYVNYADMIVSIDTQSADEIANEIILGSNGL